MKLEDVKKGGKIPKATKTIGMRIPEETYNYIKANSISLRKLIMAAVEELKGQICQLCHKEPATEGNYCEKCNKIATEAAQQDYVEDKVKDGKEAEENYT